MSSPFLLQHASAVINWFVVRTIECRKSRAIDSNIVWDYWYCDTAVEDTYTQLVRTKGSCFYHVKESGDQVTRSMP